MAVNMIIRADVQRRMLESARALTDRGEREFTRAALAAAMSYGASREVIRDELDALCDSGQLFKVRPGSGPRSALYSLDAPAAVTGPGADAPDWRPGYPGTGKMIGPAWRAIWARLADGGWHDGAELAEVGAAAGGCEVRTARGLLYPAVRAGFVETESRHDQERSRWRMWYRRPVIEGVRE